MKHASQNELEDLYDLISRVRTIPGIKERTLYHFYFKNKGILHFHSDAGSIYADVGNERILLGMTGQMESNAKEMVYEMVINLSRARES